MFTQDDLIDAILEALEPRPGRAPAPPPAAAEAPKPPAAAQIQQPRRPGAEGAPAGRIFLSEFDIKKMLTPGSQVLKIPRRAILSPLALDWLALKGIRILAE